MTQKLLLKRPPVFHFCLFQKPQGGSWFLRNDGHGAAVNIRTQWIRQKLTYDAWKAWNPLGVGDELHLIDIELPDGFEKQMNPWAGAAKTDPVPVFLEDSEFNVIYESLSGTRYRSRFTKVNGQLHTEFSKAD
jgi:hypothetical protein